MKDLLETTDHDGQMELPNDWEGKSLQEQYKKELYLYLIADMIYEQWNYFDLSKWYLQFVEGYLNKNKQKFSKTMTAWIWYHLIYSSVNGLCCLLILSNKDKYIVKK